MASTTTRPWYLAEVTSGIDGTTLATGRHCYVCLPGGDRVWVIGQRDQTAVLTVAEAARRLRTARYADGRPVRVRGQERVAQRFFEARGGRTLFPGCCHHNRAA